MRFFVASSLVALGICATGLLENAAYIATNATSFCENPKLVSQTLVRLMHSKIANIRVGGASALIGILAHASIQQRLALQRGHRGLI